MMDCLVMVLIILSMYLHIFAFLASNLPCDANLRIVTIDVKSESRWEIAYFWKLLNEIFSGIKGKEHYRFNTKALIVDENGANIFGIEDTKIVLRWDAKLLSRYSEMGSLVACQVNRNFSAILKIWGLKCKTLRKW